MMTVLDVGLIAVMIFFVAWGVWVGLIKQLALVVALLVAFAVAGVYAGEFHALATPVTTSPRISFLVSYLLLLVVVYFGVRLAILLLRRVVNFSITFWFDRILGGLFGGVKAYLLIVIFYLVFSGLSTALTPMLQNSYFKPYLATGAHYLQLLVRDKKVRRAFAPHQSAMERALTIITPELPE